MSADAYIAAGLLVLVMIFMGRILAARLRVPDAVVLVALGFAAGFLPGLGEFRLPPEVVLLVFLPPLIYSAAFFSSPRDIAAEARPIIGLAVGVTLVTAFAIAGAVYLVLPDTTWPMAIALGAALAPTDAVAATSVLRRVGAPQRIITVLEGESLINDGVALTLFTLAVSAMVAPVSVGEGTVELLRVVLGGLAYGAVVALAMAWLRSRIRDGGTQLVISLLTPFLAYIPADALGLSGVLATVVVGFYLGTHSEGLLPARVRASGATIWQGLVLVLESTLFVLLGLMLHGLLADIPHTLRDVVRALVAVALTAILVRLLWEIAVPPLARLLPRRLRHSPGSPAERTVVGWSGMRGAVSLAIALSLPTSLAGDPFPERPALILVAAVVVMLTLLGQGMTLAPLLRRLGLVPDDNTAAEVALAESRMAEAATVRLDELVGAGHVDDEIAEPSRRQFLMKLRRAHAVLHDEPDAASQRGDQARLLAGETVKAQRDALRAVYRDGDISHEVFRDLLRELDLQEPPEA
jgi:monovalent cation/hydrogen antiporter